MNVLLANPFGPGSIIVMLVIGILLFGRRLPEIGKSLGRTITEFKNGIGGIEDDVEPVSKSRSSRVVEPEAILPPQRLTATAPKFEEPVKAIAPQQV